MWYDIVRHSSYIIIIHTIFSLSYSKPLIWLALAEVFPYLINVSSRSSGASLKVVGVHLISHRSSPFIQIFHILINNPTNNVKYGSKTVSVKIEFHVVIVSKFCRIVKLKLKTCQSYSMMLESFNTTIICYNTIFSRYKIIIISHLFLFPFLCCTNLFLLSFCFFLFPRWLSN